MAYQSIYTGAEIDRRLTAVDGKIPFPSPAYAGLFPMATAQGGVQWVPRGQPTDAQTAAAISAWLAAHPEATTTVQDGSITAAKILPAFLETLANRPVLLWTNNDPTGEFAAQDIYPTTAPSNFNWIMVGFRTAPNLSNTVYMCGIVDDLTGNAATVGYGIVAARAFTVRSNRITFKAGSKWNGSSAATDNTVMVPVSIYGIK